MKPGDKVAARGVLYEKHTLQRIEPGEEGEVWDVYQARSGKVWVAVVDFSGLRTAVAAVDRFSPVSPPEAPPAP